jgi:hypothetical protein
LVFSGNALYQIDNNGLRSRIVPPVGVSYKFQPLGYTQPLMSSRPK